MLLLLATSFQGYGLGTGTISLHSWRGANSGEDDDIRDDDCEAGEGDVAGNSPYVPQIYTCKMAARSPRILRGF